MPISVKVVLANDLLAGWVRICNRMSVDERSKLFADLMTATAEDPIGESMIDLVAAVVRDARDHLGKEHFQSKIDQIRVECEVGRTLLFNMSYIVVMSDRLTVFELLVYRMRGYSECVGDDEPEMDSGRTKQRK
jgi:hypothetical protein